MRHLFFLTTVFALSMTLANAQSNVRAGAQPTTPAPAATQRATTPPSAASTSGKSTISPKPATTTREVVRKPSTESKPTAQSRDNSTASKTTTTPNKTTARSTGAVTKAPATIPAVTTRNPSTSKNVTVKQQPVAPVATIRWMTIEEALERSKTEKRKIYIDVYTDWCGWCKHMDSTTFRDQSVVNYINEKYYPVKFNAEQTSDIVYKGKTYKFTRQQGGRGHHELAALWLNNRLSYPTSVVLNEDQDIIQPIPGFQDSKKMETILHYFGTDNHKKTPWEKYERNYGKDKK
jgi:thioredoxin-related protein